jgi:hypothetical protein
VADIGGDDAGRSRGEVRGLEGGTGELESGNWRAAPASQRQQIGHGGGGTGCSRQGLGGGSALSLEVGASHSVERAREEGDENGGRTLQVFSRRSLVSVKSN